MLLVPVLVEIALILLAVFMRQPAAQIVTNRRAMTVYTNKTFQQVWLSQIQKLVHFRANGKQTLDVHGSGATVSLPTTVYHFPTPGRPDGMQTFKMHDLLSRWRDPEIADREPAVRYPP